MDSGLGRNHPSRTVQTEGAGEDKVRTLVVDPGVGLLDGMEACRRDAVVVLRVASVARACRRGPAVRGVACQGIRASGKIREKNILKTFFDVNLFFQSLNITGSK